jgi:hypothetical protein
MPKLALTKLHETTKLLSLEKLTRQIYSFYFVVIARPRNWFITGKLILTKKKYYDNGQIHSD